MCAKAGARAALDPPQQRPKSCTKPEEQQKNRKEHERNQARTDLEGERWVFLFQRPLFLQKDGSRFQSLDKVSCLGSKGGLPLFSVYSLTYFEAPDTSRRRDFMHTNRVMSLGFCNLAGLWVSRVLSALPGCRLRRCAP